MTDPPDHADPGPAALAWGWRPVVLPPGPPPGATLALAAHGRRATLVAARPDGGPVEPVVFDGEGAAHRSAPLPLVSVSGAAGGPHGVVVAGAAPGDGSPRACELDPATGEAAATDLPVGDAPLAVWPVPVAADPVRVVWATGRAPSTLWCGTLTAGGLILARADVDAPVWTVQPVAAPGGVDVLCQTPAGGLVVRFGDAAAAEPALPAFPSGATLSPGAVLAARGAGHLDAWETATAAHHDLVLPAPAGEGPTAVAAPRVVPALGLLVWETQFPDTAGFAGDEAGIRTLAGRGWAALLDRERWRIGPAAELPVAPLAMTVLDGALVVAARSGVWIGRAEPVA
ncbi:MAG TPA: hypothetical protein VFI47_12200 [Acidimicrobiales bacterium]|nr:hypothetical protein [Acidimicrobiales bacterium]